MYEIDRLIAIIKPTNTLLNWLRAYAQQASDLTLADIRNDSTAFLIPIFEEPTHALSYIQRFYVEIFENELASWEIEETFWPQDRSWQTFMEWFDIEFHSIVYDMMEEDEIGMLEKTLQ